MNSPNEHGNCADAALQAPEWKSVIDIADRNTTADDGVRFESAQQTDGAATKIKSG